ncbi:MAG: triple tyrosine motif-containing protein, partial [Fulvivirga sp.]|uniref:triple tyrosine motif-containing protein n=1 Tax=Fulvivirga sp. TaxID=1931237 RepID=UPI0032EBF939
LIYNENRELVYMRIGDSTVYEKEIYDIALKGNELIGLSANAIYIIDLETNKTKEINAKYSGELYELHLIENEVYVSTEKSGLQLLADNDLIEPGIEAFDKLDVQFLTNQPNSKKVLLGTLDNNLYLLEDGKVNPVAIDDADGYLSNSAFVDGTWISDSLYAIATLKGGVIFINHLKNKIEQVINYQSGLPDNEVFAFSKDTHGGIWVAHSGGFTRISPNLPFRSFHKYPGLNGSLISVINHNNSLYVGTSEGLYYLKRVNNYEEKQVVEKQTVFKEVPIQDTDDKSGKKGFLGLFSKKNKEQEPIETRRKKSIVLRSRTVKELKSVDFEFVKVPKVQSKVLQFQSLDDDLYCGGLDGIFKIDGASAETVTTTPVHHFAVAKRNNLILASTYENQIKTYALNGPNREVNLFYDFKDKVDNIFEDSEGRIWLSSSDEVYYIEIENGEIGLSESFPINNPYMYTTLGNAKGEAPTFVNESGEFTINMNLKSIQVLDSTKNLKYLSGVNGEVWVYHKEQWNKLSEKTDNERLNLLSLFKNIKYISSEKDEYYWVITENNELYKILGADIEVTQPYDLYLKYIKNSDRTLLPKDQLKFEQSNSTLLFEFAQPEFSGILDVKYQYLLEGLDEKWSEWSGENNIISFPYLPDGEYTLRVRSKNILGDIKEVGPINFEIVPPYWKRPWFYAFEFCGLAILLFISVRLKNLGFKYRLASRLLALITLIIIIEFIQTVAENEFANESSPVFDFLIQVTIAIIVLPIESLIRKYIFREKNVQILDFVSLKDKKIS